MRVTRTTERPPLERDIQSACVDLLQLDGWRPLRTDPVSDRKRGKGFGEKGMADHLFVRYRTGRVAVDDRLIGAAWAEVFWVEFKRVTASGRPSEVKQHQLTWHRDERLRGAMTAIAGIDFTATVDGFVEWYRASGLMRRRI